MRILLFALFCYFLSSYSLAQGQAPRAVPNEILVKFKDHHNQFTVLGKVATKAQIINKKSWPGLNLHHFSTKPGDSVESAIERLKNDPSVEFAEPNYYVYASSGGSTNTFTQSSANIKVTQAWTLLSTPDSIDQLPIVAIIDSGLDLEHAVFKNTDRVYINSGEIPGNSVDDDGNGFVDDVSGWNFVSENSNVFDSTGHGTHVSGIVLGVTENIVNFNSQLSPRIQILPLKFLNSDGVGKTSDAIEAINYAIAIGAKVINNSWGGPSYSSTLHSVFKNAYNAGITIVAAAGNEASNNDVVSIYPASLDVPSLISVAASTEQDSYASFSNYGVNTTHIFAPGVGIYSTLPDNDYGLSTGTSMAAPFISGLAALIHAEAPNLSGFQVKDIILSTGTARTWFLSYVESGRRVNFEDAIQEAKLNVNEPNYLPDYTPNYALGSRDLASTNDVASGLGCGRVSSILDSSDGFSQNKSPTNSGFIFLLLPLFLLIFRKLKSIHEKLKQTELNLRQSDRQVVDYQGHIVTSQGYVLPVLVKDLSNEGVGLQIYDFDSSHKIENIKDVVLNFNPSDAQVQRVKAEVRRSTKDGFVGLRFKKN